MLFDTFDDLMIGHKRIVMLRAYSYPELDQRNGFRTFYAYGPIKELLKAKSQKKIEKKLKRSFKLTKDDKIVVLYHQAGLGKPNDDE